jgi:hypothetical protein
MKGVFILLQQSVSLRFADCGNFEWGIQRAIANRARNKENKSKNTENDCRNARNAAGQIKDDDRYGQQSSYDPIDSSHVLFHMLLLSLTR